MDYPRHFDSKSKDLIKKLLVADRTKRIGCLKGGAEDIKRHKFFSKMDWAGLFHQEIKASYIPVIQGAGDHQNFDPYPDSPISQREVVISKQDQVLFQEFNTF